MKFFALLLLASCTTILPTYAQDAGASTSAQAKAVTPLQQELINTQRAFMDAVERHDLDYVKNAIADDFVGIGTTGDADHKSDVLAGLRVDQSRKEKDKKEKEKAKKKAQVCLFISDTLTFKADKKKAAGATAPSAPAPEPEPEPEPVNEEATVEAEEEEGPEETTGRYLSFEY